MINRKSVTAQAWRDFEFASTLSESEQASLPESPAGKLKVLRNPDLQMYSTFISNTCDTFISGCCSSFISNTCDTFISGCCG